MSEGFTFRPEQFDPMVLRGLLDVSTIDLERGPSAPPGIVTLTAVLYARHAGEVQGFFLNPERLEQLLGEVDPDGILGWGPIELREATAKWVDQAWRGHDADAREDQEQGVSTQIDPSVVNLLRESITIAARADRGRASIGDVMTAFAEQPEIRQKLYELTGLIFKQHPREAT